VRKSHYHYYVRHGQSALRYTLLHRPPRRPRSPPVAYAIDPRRDLSPTPQTPIGAVAGVGDRYSNLSLA